MSAKIVTEIKYTLYRCSFKEKGKLLSHKKRDQKKASRKREHRERERGRERERDKARDNSAAAVRSSRAGV